MNSQKKKKEFAFEIPWLEFFQIVVTDNMTVFCQGQNEINFTSEATGTVYNIMKNCV